MNRYFFTYALMNNLMVNFGGFPSTGIVDGNREEWRTDASTTGQTWMESTFPSFFLKGKEGTAGRGIFSFLISDSNGFSGFAVLEGFFHGFPCQYFGV